MRWLRLTFPGVSALIIAGGCASSNGHPMGAAPERILAVDATGKVLRQSTSDERSQVTFAAPLSRVWVALRASYAEAGIEPTVSDAAAGQYGNAAFAVPRRLMDRPIAQFFDCGIGLNGPLVSAGRVTALVMTTLTPLPDGTTSAMTQVTGSLRRSDSATGVRWCAARRGHSRSSCGSPPSSVWQRRLDAHDVIGAVTP